LNLQKVRFRPHPLNPCEFSYSKTQLSIER